MSRGITNDLAAALIADPVSAVRLVKMDFDSGTVRLHTRLGNLVWAGETWQGVGSLLEFNDPSETTEVRATGGTIKLNGLDPSWLPIADSEHYQGRPITTYIGAFDSDDVLIVDPDPAYRGQMDVMEPVDEAETASITLSIESRAAAFERANTRHNTPEDQRLLYPGDKGFDYVARQVEKEIVWKYPV